MDSAEFLDLLGNDNRRRILRLLARKPCYVTEISEFIGVSPKAVIDHLQKLEDAGLVESRTDDRRRKYFSISRHVRLEVTVSPYEFGTKSAYPASSTLDMTSCRQLSIKVSGDEVPVTDSGNAETDGESDGTAAVDEEPTAPVGEEPERNSDDVVRLTKRLREFEQLENELSLAQRWAQGRITELREQLADSVAAEDPRLVSEVLLALADDGSETEAISRKLDVPPPIVEDVLDELAEQGVVFRDGGRWHLQG